MPCFVAQSFVLAAFATLVCQRNCVFLCKGTKLKNSACAEFLDSLLWFVAQSWGFAPNHGTELWFVTQSFAFAVFATLICLINSVFPCKDTKAAKSVAFCDSLPVFLWHRALFMHRALRIGTVNLHNMPELYSWKINKRIKYWRKFFL